ncbi:DNA-processing protein DprA [Patescibacteria group bacterium]|nr:DNA-processing protein DprA [Patescibacteria group bacterium]
MQESKLPSLLREIPDPPKKLYVRGELPSHDEYKFLTVIGSRKFSIYGKQVCEHLIRGLAGYPIVIVSGLALGMDTIAHRAAIENNLKTLAVPGSGLDDKVIYPATNQPLAREILKHGGCLVSEFEPDFKATRWSFPQRNRTMAGISHAVLVIEAENISGTRITARLATDYNREVFAIPGSIFSPVSGGTNELIREGATPVTSAKDILDFFGFTNENQPSQMALDGLSDDETMIMNALSEPRSRSQLADTAGISIIKLNVLLSAMEIKGLIKERLGKIYRVQ